METERSSLWRELLAGDSASLLNRLHVGRRDSAWRCVGLIALGCGAYGACIGLWRSETQALFTGVKFPVVVGLTCLGNALLNGMLGQLLGVGLGFRQSLLALLMSFSAAAVMLLAFVPLMLFLLYNTPALESGGNQLGHSITVVAHVAVIAFAGCVGNLRLFGLLRGAGGSSSQAISAVLCWLGGNLLLGSQLSWILRPFIGNPNLPVEFLRSDPLNGNFFEQLLRSIDGLY